MTPAAGPARPIDPLVQTLERRLQRVRAERDALRERLAQREPADHADRLEDLIERRTRALRATRDEAVAASQAKSSFLANMSHEIRTPLTSIIGFGELLLDPQVSAADKSGAVETIIRNGRHLLEVINDILDLSKIETRQLEIERLDVPLPEVLVDVEALVAGRAREKGLRFRIARHLPLPPALRTDPVRLKQILLNFCGNAIKFSKEGEVRIDVRHDAAAERVSFEVTDRGIGMSAAQIERLFQPFTQADVSTTRQFGGTGLGLYICRQLADLLGGTITVASTPGQGSCFTLSLPVGRHTRAFEMLTDERDFASFHRPDFQITAIEVPVLRGRVLLAEDGVDNQRLLATYLRQAGLDVDIVGNGRAALEQARARDYALVLMDIQMPLMDGVAATQALRGAGQRVPIVALTANVMKADVARYRACGCDDVLAKPVDRVEFYRVLARHVGGAAPPVPAAPRASDKGGAYARELAALTEEFRAGLPATLDAIVEAAVAARWPEVRRALHTLRGTAGSYGFARISALAAEAEAGIADAAPRDGHALCAKLARGARQEIAAGASAG